MILFAFIYCSMVLIALSEEIAPINAYFNSVPLAERLSVKTDNDIVVLDASESLDYRKNGQVTKVKHQKGCEGGWAFAITGLIEGQYAKETGNLVEFSTQELVDCMLDCGGCQFCDADTAMSALEDLGSVEQDDDYPFVGKKRRCNYKPALLKLRVTDYTIQKMGCEYRLKHLLDTYGPLYIAIDGDSLKGYRRGILQNCSYKQTNHAVLLIGYGSENGVDYWLIKNSWGAVWGEKGYGRIRRGVNACGLLNEGVLTAKIKIV